MPPRPVRRFTLIDAMILVAAAALGMAGARSMATYPLQPTVLYSGPQWMPIQPYDDAVDAGPPPWDVEPILGPAPVWFQAAQGWAGSARPVAPGLAALSLAMLVIRLRRPRPAWPRLARQAGMIASLAVVAALGVQLLLTVLRLAIPRFMATGQLYLLVMNPQPTRLSLALHQTIRPELAGTVVLASWLILTVGGRRRRRGGDRGGRGWVDWGGIAVGLGWSALLLIDWFNRLDEPVG